MLFSPVAIPHSAENAENATIEITYNRRRPIRSPSQALAGTTTPRHSVYAVVTHWMLSVETPNSCCIVGIATFTMLVSRVDMNMPITTTASGTIHFVFCAAPPDPGEGRGGGSGGRCSGGVGGVRFGELSAGRLPLARDRGATSTAPPGLVSRLVSPSRLSPPRLEGFMPPEDHS